MLGLVVGRSHKRYLTRLVGHFPVTDVDAMMAARRALLFAALLVTAGSADAAQINIVALGASNTYGKGVARGQDFPAQLQAMLRAKGLDARVANAGINGDTTGGMLGASRLRGAVRNPDRHPAARRQRSAQGPERTRIQHRHDHEPAWGAQD
jgi:hypothetical protein